MSCAGGGKVLSIPERVYYLRKAGFKSIESIANMLAASIGESQGCTTASGGGAYGWLQIQLDGTNRPYTPQQLYDPLFNAQKAFEISNGGTNFTPWTTLNAHAMCGNSLCPGAGDSLQYIDPFSQYLSGKMSLSEVAKRTQQPANSDSSGGGGILGGIGAGIGDVGGAAQSVIGIPGAAIGAVAGIPGDIVGGALSGIGKGIIQAFQFMMPYLVIGIGILILMLLIGREIANRGGAGAPGGGGASAPMPIPE